MPEYCQIIPDFCHLDVIREETSASDEDFKKDMWKCSGKTSEVNGFKLPDYSDISDIDQENNRKLNAISEVKLIETIPSECHLERLESPSLVRESEILRFADIVFTENECTNEVEVFEPLKRVSIDLNNVKMNECIKQETRNNLNCQTNSTDYTLEVVKNIENETEKQNNESKILSNPLTIHCSAEQNTSRTNIVLAKESNEVNFYDDVRNRTNSVQVHCTDNNNLDVLNAKSQSVKSSTSAELKRDVNTSKYNAFSKTEHRTKAYNDVSRQENTENGESSDDSTIKQCETYNSKSRTRNKNEVSIYDKLKRIASLLQDDTDDYEEIQTSQTTSRCVSLASDADVDTDWVSFTLSDGESSKSLCLSPSQLRSGHAPSTVSETSELIDLHLKFSNRTRSPNLSSHQQDTCGHVDILGYGESPSPSPSKSYASEVFDEACRMCGTSDEPLSDAECLVSLRKYRETRSRLLDVIQNERRLDHRSVIDRPSTMPTFIDTLSVPDNRTRELMYAEYMEKVKEREDRLHNKVIRITKASRPLSSGTLQALNDIDTEFVTRARERLEKLGVEADVKEAKEEYYPKHLVDIVPEEEVCIEEVQVNGESSGLSVYVFCFFFVLFCFTNTVFAVWPSLIKYVASIRIGRRKFLN